jgi:hypothetical protein
MLVSSIVFFNILQNVTAFFDQPFSWTNRCNIFSSPDPATAGRRQREHQRSARGSAGCRTAVATWGKGGAALAVRDRAGHAGRGARATWLFGSAVLVVRRRGDGST